MASNSECDCRETEKFMSEQPLDVFFIRHTDDMDVDDRTREVLWKNHLVGIHFPFDKDDRTRDSERTSPEYYTDKRARKALFLFEPTSKQWWLCL